MTGLVASKRANSVSTNNQPSLQAIYQHVPAVWRPLAGPPAAELSAGRRAAAAAERRCASSSVDTCRRCCVNLRASLAQRPAVHSPSSAACSLLTTSVSDK